MRSPVLAVLALFGLAGGCLDPLERCAGREVGPGDELECVMPGWLDRSYRLSIPAGWDGATPLPLIVELHGGGGNRTSAERVTCPGGDRGHPGCLSAIAATAGYAVVAPDGTGTRPVRNLRTWNAGGGVDEWQCVSGAACRSGADDVRYLDELLAEVGRVIPVDSARIHATGLSNGGAMSHRLACERPEVFASVAAVAGANQFAAAGGACPGGVPLLHLHGTEDPCWGYEGGGDGCAQLDGGLKVGVEASMDGWRARNGCSELTTEEALPDVDPTDGSTTRRIAWTGCSRAVELYRVDGGAHTWPSGYQYLGTDTVGRPSRDFGSEVIVEFFRAHPR